MVPMQDVLDELNLVLNSDKKLFRSWLGDATGVICHPSDYEVHNHRITSPYFPEYGEPEEDAVYDPLAGSPFP
jgi:hypothetical protein